MSKSLSYRSLRVFTTAALATALVTTAACGGDDGVDPVEQLVGTWDEVDDGGVGTSSYTFSADGTFVFQEFDGAGAVTENTEGTFTADGFDIGFDGEDSVTGDRATLDTTYFANDLLFSLAALLVEGEADGVVGTWNGSILIESTPADGSGVQTLGIDTTLVINADLTATLTQTPLGDAPQAVDGTVTDMGNGSFVFTFSPDGMQMVNIGFDLLDGLALSGITYTRSSAARQPAPTSIDGDAVLQRGFFAPLE